MLNLRFIFLSFLFLFLFSLPANADYWKLVATTREVKNPGPNDPPAKIEETGTGVLMSIVNNYYWVQKGGRFESSAVWTIPPAALIPGNKIRLHASHKVLANGLNALNIGHFLNINGHRGDLSAEEKICSTHVHSQGKQISEESGEWTVPGTDAQKIWVTVTATDGGAVLRKIIYAYQLASGNPSESATPTESATSSHPDQQTTESSAADSAAAAGLLSSGKPAQQSSVSQWSNANDAQGAVDGIINGSFGFCTGKQPNPWWQVDLGIISKLSEIVIYNRIDYNPERSRTIQVLLSTDNQTWKTFYSHDGTIFGGKDGHPLKVPLKGSSARFVRLQLTEDTWFHLDEVEIYGSAGSN